MNDLRLAHPLFHEPAAKPTSAKQLAVVSMPFTMAKKLNALWHSRLPRFGTGSIANQSFPSWAAEYEGVYYAVAIWSNPVARNLPQHAWLELRRLAICDEAPKFTASRMLSVMAKTIYRTMPHVERLISYQDTEVHTGTIYKASGWTATRLSEGDEWDRPGRSRPKAQSDAPKQRWEKVLRAVVAT